MVSSIMHWWKKENNWKNKNGNVFIGENDGMSDYSLLNVKSKVVEEWRNKVRVYKREIIQVKELNDNEKENHEYHKQMRVVECENAFLFSISNKVREGYIKKAFKKPAKCSPTWKKKTLQWSQSLIRLLQPQVHTLHLIRFVVHI